MNYNDHIAENVGIRMIKEHKAGEEVEGLVYFQGKQMMYRVKFQVFNKANGLWSDMQVFEE